MKRNFGTEITFIIFLLIFCTIRYFANSENYVLKIYSPTRIAVDLNHDRKVESDEIFCISGIETFGDDIYDFNEKLAKDLSIEYKNAISLAYLSSDFARRSLISKPVKVVPDGTKSTNCTGADIIVNNKSYKSILYDNGFGFDENSEYNKERFGENLKIAQKLHPVIFNRKSAKYHEIDCKYGRVSENYAIILKEDLPSDAIPCKWCHSATDSENQSPQTFPDKMSDGDITVVFTDMTRTKGVNKNCSTYICKSVVEKINSAKTSIDIAAYGWVSIEKIDNAIKDAVARGVKFRFVYDYTAKPLYYPDCEKMTKLAEDFKNDYEQDKISHREYLMHNKFMIIDGEKVMTGSLNFSDTDYSAFNSNFVAFINSKEIAKIYTDEFEQMLSGKFHKDKQKRKNYSKYVIGNSEVEVYFSPQDKIITNHVLNYVNSAKKYIYIPAFVVTHKELEKALLAAYKRGVDVKLIIDATNANASKSAVKSLRNGGVPVKIENFAGKVHSKSIIIDDEYILAGSMNLSRSGENFNDENMLIIKNPKFARFYREFFEYLWNKIPDKYLLKSPSAESVDSFGSCSDGIDNDFDGKIDLEDDGCKMAKELWKF